MSKTKVTFEELLTDLGIKVKHENGNYKTVHEGWADLLNVYNILSNESRDKVKDYLSSLI